MGVITVANFNGGFDKLGNTNNLNTVKIVGISPTNGESNVNLNRQIQIRFDGNLDESGKSGTITLDDMTFRGNGISIESDTIKITPPNGSWKPGRRYQGILIDGFKAANGTKIKEYKYDSYNFTTRDDFVLLVQLYDIYPKSGSTNVYTDDDILINFDGRLDTSKAGGTITLGGDTISPDRISIGDYYIIISPPNSGWATGKEYRGIFVSGFKALNGTTIQEYKDDNYNFTTRSNDQSVPLKFKSIAPSKGASGVDIGVTIKISFTRDLDDSQIGYVELEGIPFSDITISGNTIEVNTGTLLEYGKTYTDIEVWEFKGVDGDDVYYNDSDYSFKTRAAGSVETTTTSSISPGGSTTSSTNDNGGGGTSTTSSGGEGTPTTSGGPTTTLAPIGNNGVYITKIQVQSDRGEWANRQLVIFGLFGDNGSEYYYPETWPYTYDMAKIRGTVSNDLKFEYVFDPPLILTGTAGVDKKGNPYDGVLFEGWIVDPNSGTVYNGAPNKLEEGNSTLLERDGRIYLENPKDGKSYILYQNMYEGWSWQLKLDEGGPSIPVNPGVTTTTIGGGGTPTTIGGGGGNTKTITLTVTPFDVKMGASIYFYGNFNESNNETKAIRGDWSDGNTWKSPVLNINSSVTLKWKAIRLPYSWGTGNPPSVNLTGSMIDGFHHSKDYQTGEKHADPNGSFIGPWDDDIEGKNISSYP